MTKKQRPKIKKDQIVIISLHQAITLTPSIKIEEVEHI
jgi:hypothetical protein